MVDQPGADSQPVLMLDYVDRAEQYIPARKTVKPRPQPRQTTVADFMVNKFQALSEKSSSVSIRSSTGLIDYSARKLLLIKANDPTQSRPTPRQRAPDIKNDVDKQISFVDQSPPDGSPATPSPPDGIPPPPPPSSEARPPRERSLRSMHAEARSRRGVVSTWRAAWQDGKQECECDCTHGDDCPPKLEHPDDEPEDLDDVTEPRNGYTEPVCPPQSQLGEPVIKSSKIKMARCLSAGTPICGISGAAYPGEVRSC